LDHLRVAVAPEPVPSAGTRCGVLTAWAACKPAKRVAGSRGFEGTQEPLNGEGLLASLELPDVPLTYAEPLSKLSLCETADESGLLQRMGLQAFRGWLPPALVAL
jgi:hypothetical protein